MTGTASHAVGVSGDTVDSRSAVAHIGAIAWPAFFAAGVATTVFFAIVDPLDLAEITWPHAAISRELGYSIGFFMFWACTLASSLFTALLLRPPRAPAVRRERLVPDEPP